MTKPTESPPEFQTSDLGIAAFLLAQGIPLLGVVPGSDWKSRFRFPASARETAGEYWRGATIPARAFFNAIHDLKSNFSPRREEGSR